MRHVTTFFVVSVSALALWIFVTWDSVSVRYKLTYVVDVKGETRTGSGVIEIRAEDTSKLPLLGRGFGSSATGEAVVVDLGDGRFLFSLLNNAATLPFKPFIEHYKGDNTGIDVLRTLRSEKPSTELEIEQLPMLVTFSNLSDPKSVRKVNPYNLAATFGSGIKLDNVKLEITDEPVTKGAVDPVLRWLSDVGDWMLDGQRLNTASLEKKLANNLTRLDFKRD